MTNDATADVAASVRAFVALPLSPATIEQLAAVQALVSTAAAHDATRLRLVPTHQFHVTLAFLGNVVRSRVESIIGAATDLSSQFAEFRLVAERLVIFPSIQRARVVGVALEDSGTGLAQAVSRLHVRLRESGFALEQRAFRAHVTLARLRSPQRFSFELGDIGSSVQPITCPRITVYESELGATGSKYHELHSALLGTGPSPA